MNILDGLNKEQLKAVTHKSGPLLIIAGAGTGKTTVVTRRIAHLISSGQVRADQILALTFTEKAAGEMEERVDALLPIGYFDLWISTFHAFCERILRDHALDVGLSNDFKMLTGTEQWMLLREHIDSFELDYYRPKGNPTKFVQALIEHFSRLKDEDITPEEYIEFAEKLRLDTDAEFKKSKQGLSDEDQAKVDEAQRITEVASAYKQYQDLLREQSAMDFGDLIVETIHLLKQRPALLEKYRQKFTHILVDEFQDTNFAQYDLIKLLSAPQNNLTVVADDDQSIYRFRGASMSNIIVFKDDFKDTEEVSLVQNYRSKQGILDLAYEFIKHNNPNRLEETLKIDKKLHSNNEGEAVIEHLHSQSLEGEAKLVLDKIIELKKGDKKLAWNDFAILVRANDQAQTFIPYLERAKIPYQFLASKGLFAKPIILDVIAFLKLLDNYHESRAMYRVLSYEIWNIPHEDIIGIVQHGTKKTLSIYETCKEIRSVGKLKKNTYETVEQLMVLIERITNDVRHKTVGEIVLMFLEGSGYLKNVTELETQKATEKILYLNQFYKYIEAFEKARAEKSVNGFVLQLSSMLEAGEEGRVRPDFDEGPEAVKIMTVHGAKGLEFEHVFVVNLVDKRFPTIKRRAPIPIPDEIIKDILPEGDWHLEEERRLFYVAMTRAKTGLFLTSGQDYGGVRKKKPSRFLVESGFVDTAPTPTGEVLFSKDEPVHEFSKKEILQFVPTTFSFTQLKAYETCPWQYRFAFLLRVPVPGKASFSFGKTMHAALYEFFRQIKESRDMQQGGLFDSASSSDDAPEVKLPSLDTLLEIYEAKWVGDWYVSKSQRDEYYKKGKATLKEFYKLHENNWPEVSNLEEGFSVQVGEYKLKGAIDRIDIIKDGADGQDGVEIIDYKTGKFPKSGKKDMEQLYLYALAVREVFQKDPVKLSYYYLEDNKAITQEFDASKLANVEDWILDLIGNILSGELAPTPGFHCKYCDYKGICEYRKT